MTRVPDFSTVDVAGATPATIPARAEPWLTPEGIAVKPAYGPDDLAGLDFLDTYPGLPPFLRGPYPTMYVTQPWTIRQYAGFSTAEDSNAFYRRNLAAGQKGLSIAFDLATHRGYDSDHPRVAGDVGMAGVAIDSIYDMRTLFDRIPLDQMSVSMTMNGAVLPVLALYIVAAEEQGVPPEQLAGTIQNDILKEFMVRNTYIYPPEPSLRIISDIFAYTAAHMPKFNSISISGYHMQEAGATVDLELAYTLADGVEYVRAGHRGRARDRPLRAAAVVLLERRHELLHGGRQAARRAHAVGEADEGVRAEVGEVAGAARAHPDLGLVARLARRHQQRGAHLHRGDGGDAGRHAVAAHQRARRGARAAERLLRAHRAQHADRAAAGERHDAHHRSLGRLVLCRAAHRTSLRSRAWGHIQEVEEIGGMAKAIEAGLPKLRIEEAAARTQARIDAGLQSVIGVNEYRRAEEPPVELLKVDNAAVRAVADREARAAASASATRRRSRRRSRRSRATPAAATRNLLALAVDAARAKATVGEISSALETGVRPPPRRDQGDHRRLQAGGRHVATPSRACRSSLPRSRRPKAAARASWSPRSARTATTAARR